MHLNLTGPALVLPPGTRRTDDELMRLSGQYGRDRFERAPNGEIGMMSPVDGLGSTHEMYVSRMLANGAEEPAETLEGPDVVIGHVPIEGFPLRAARLRAVESGFG